MWRRPSKPGDGSYAQDLANTDNNYSKSNDLTGPAYTGQYIQTLLQLNISTSEQKQMQNDSKYKINTFTLQYIGEFFNIVYAVGVAFQ